jgi:hypothetical protein
MAAITDTITGVLTIAIDATKEYGGSASSLLFLNQRIADGVSSVRGWNGLQGTNLVTTSAFIPFSRACSFSDNENCIRDIVGLRLWGGYCMGFIALDRVLCDGIL